MIPLERAEKIVREISYGYGDTQLRGVSSGNVKWVAAQIEEAIFDSSVQCVKDHASQSRIKAWLSESPRRPALTAFTEGADRQMAYLIEQAEREAVLYSAPFAEGFRAGSDLVKVPAHELRETFEVGFCAAKEKAKGIAEEQGSCQDGCTCDAAIAKRIGEMGE